MKSFALLTIDVIIVLFATMVAIILRDNFELSYLRIIEMLPYLFATIISSITLMPLFGINRVIWRFSALPDYLRLTLTLAAITIGSLAIAFAFNRLDSVPRSLPFLQFNLSISLLVGLRVFYRLHHLARRSRETKMVPLKLVQQPAAESVLLVGISRLTETYLQSISELARGRIRVAGILGHRSRQVGRLLATHKILGTPEDLEQVLSDLEVCGVVIDKIVITACPASFSHTALQAISAIRHSRSIEVIYLSEQLGFEPVSKPPLLAPADTTRATPTDPIAFEIQPDELKVMQVRSYWAIKRLVDVLAALSLLIIMSPIMIVVSVCLLVSIGKPLLFWQQRPGLGGRPFRLYKFRTMGAAYAADRRMLSDNERVSKVGAFLRRTRLDELPQLFNVIRGDMSFVGPRPLLPRDQDNAFRARLFVRPGLTGWAQVVGGRAISAEDKAALDVWYVKHASLFLDLKVVLKTIPIVIFGETISKNSIEAAWRDLRETGVLRSGFTQPDYARKGAAV